MVTDPTISSWRRLRISLHVLRTLHRCACGSKTTASASKGNFTKRFLDFLSGCIHRTLFRGPASDWPSCERELNEWADAWAWNPGLSRAAVFGSNFPPLKARNDREERKRRFYFLARSGKLAKWKIKFYTSKIIRTTSS